MKAVLFDMDGLMIDSERLWETSWNEAAVELGLDFPEGLYRQTIGLTWSGSRALLSDALGHGFPLEELIEASENRYRERMETWKFPKEGLYELMDFLESRGILMGVGTSTHRVVADRKLKKIGVAERLSFTVCGDEVINGKPDPEPYLKLAKGIGMDPEDCLVLEDSYNGVRAAAAAKIGVVMVPDLLEPTPEMEDKCIRIVDTLLDVKQLIIEAVL